MKRHLYAIPLAATLIVPAAFAQQNSTPATSDTTPAQTQTQPATETQSTQQTPAASSDAASTTNGQYATGAPLQGQNKEGFWGHLMPFARKKYVSRQMDPIRGRVEVALLKNGAADLGGNAVGATQGTTNPQAGVTPTPHQ